jgi:kynureninase
MAQGYDPEPDIRRYLAGTPGILALAAADVGITISAEAGIEAIRAKGIALTEYAIALHDTWLADRGCSIGSPRDAHRRGAHVTTSFADVRRGIAAIAESLS